MALTFVRTSELIGARWEEFDFDARRWSIPASRMKVKTPHIVPLSSQAIEVLEIFRTISGNGELVFPGEQDSTKPMSNMTILKALERMGYKGRMTGHGFRAWRPPSCMSRATITTTSNYNLLIHRVTRFPPLTITRSIWSRART